MAIIQISKIQVRSGNLVDLPQLDEAEFGWASDDKRLFIGKVTPNENIEVLTSYSDISFSQLDGSVGNLDINPVTIQDGQVLAYNANNSTWENRGGDAGGIINLGDVGNVKINGGAISYVLETDGTGNLSWAPKGAVVSYIENVTPAFVSNAYATTTTAASGLITLTDITGYNVDSTVVFSGTPFGGITDNINYYVTTVFSGNNTIAISTSKGGANVVLSDDSGNMSVGVAGTIVQTVEENFFVNGTEITITDVTGMTELNGNTYFCNVISSNSFILCADQLLTPVDSFAYNTFPYTNVTDTNASNDRITIGDSTLFTANDTVMFIGDMSNTGLSTNTLYFVYDLPTSTTMRISTTNDGNISNVINLTTQSSLIANVFVYGGRIISAIGGAGTTPAGGSNTQLQFNSLNILQGSPDLTFDYTASPKILTLNGNANVGNLNSSTLVTATRLVSNVATGTAPLTVTSKTKVANLYVDRSGNSDSIYTVNQTTGTYYPVFVSAGTTANYALGSNTNFTFNALTGNLSTTLLNVTSNANVGNIGATAGVFSGNVSVTSNITAGNVYANSGAIGASLLTGTLTTQSQPNVTSLGNGTQVTVNGNLNPSSNVTFSLGNNTSRWNNLYLSGSTIFLGNSVITSNASGVVITNPSGGSFTVVGSSSSNTNALVNGSSNIVVNNNSNIAFSSGGTANVLRITSTGANITGTANVSGNANVGNIGGTGAVFTTVAGSLTTASQPNVTSVGTLTSLAVTGTTTSGNIYANTGTIGASLLTGTLTTNAQPNVTSLGTLTSLSVTGTTTSGNIYANAGTIGASLLTGIVTTNAQPNITSVGTLTSLTVTGSTTSGNVYANSGTVSGANLIASANVIAGNVYANSGTIGAITLTATNLTGTLTTAAQPNITSIGTLSTLSVTGNANVGNIGASAGVFTTVAGSLTTAAQPNITSVGTISNLIVSGNTTTGGIKTDNYYYANGVSISFAGAYSNSNVANYLPTYTGTVGTGNAIFTGRTLTTGANTTSGTITGNWTLSTGSRLQATYADLAEYYEADAHYEAGTVLEFGGDKEVTVAQDESSRVAGVVSTDPAFAMHAKCQGIAVAIALQGRVPVKVRGKIEKGDMMVSGGDGFARASRNPIMGSVIGKALQNFNDIEGIIEIAVGRL